MSIKINVYVSNADDGSTSPPLREVRDVSQQLNSNKSASKDGIGAEFIKMGSLKLAIGLHRMIGTI